MAVKKNATEAAEAAKKEKTVNTTTEEKKADSGADNEATGGETVTLAYIGPPLPAGLLKTNKIMIGTRGRNIEGACSSSGEYPLVEKMLVPVEKLAEKKGKAATAGNILNKYYTDIVSAIAASERKEE